MVISLAKPDAPVALPIKLLPSDAIPPTSPPLFPETMLLPNRSEPPPFDKVA